MVDDDHFPDVMLERSGFTAVCIYFFLSMLQLQKLRFNTYGNQFQYSEKILSVFPEVWVRDPDDIKRTL